MIVSDRCLQSAVLRWDPRLFASPFTRTVAEWCVNYWRQYNRAPQGHVRDMYEMAKRNGLDPEQGPLIEKFLAGISDEFDRQEFNADYNIDISNQYFSEREIRLLNERVSDLLAAGQTLQARAAIATFNQPQGTLAPGLNLFADPDTVRRVLEDKEDLLELPGPMGILLRPLRREHLLGISAPYKVGKSWFLIWMSLQAFASKLNVAYFSLEMGEDEVYSRFLQAITGLPGEEEKGIVRVPVWDCVQNQTGACSDSRRPGTGRLYDASDDRKQRPPETPPGYVPCDGRCGLYESDVWYVNQKVGKLGFNQAWAKAKAVMGVAMGARFKLQCWPAFSAGLDDVEAALQIWEFTENFVPDIIAIDYPTILKLKGEGRDSIDVVWKGCKALGQRRKCLVLAPTQAGGKEVLQRVEAGRDGRLQDVAEDSRILGHVDGMVFINQTEQEASLGVARIARTAGRHAKKFGRHAQVIVLQQLGAGQVVLDSRWRK